MGLLAPEHNHCASLNRWIVLQFISRRVFVGQIAHIVFQHKHRSGASIRTTHPIKLHWPNNTQHNRGKHQDSRGNILEMHAAAKKRDWTKTQIYQADSGRCVCVCICVSLPCVHLCSALWAWGKGQRSCGWSRCWLVTASSPPSTGSRPSLPAPRTTALQTQKTEWGVQKCKHVFQRDRPAFRCEVTQLGRLHAQCCVLNPDLPS